MNNNTHTHQASASASASVSALAANVQRQRVLRAYLHSLQYTHARIQTHTHTHTHNSTDTHTDTANTLSAASSSCVSSYPLESLLSLLHTNTNNTPHSSAADPPPLHVSDRRRVLSGVLHECQRYLLSGASSSADGMARLNSLCRSDLLDLSAYGLSDSDEFWRSVQANHCPHLSVREIEIHWRHWLDPRINNTIIQEEESAQISAMYDNTDDSSATWISVSERLGSNRPPLANYTAYVRQALLARMRGQWSESDDAYLYDTVQREGEANNWQAICDRVNAHSISRARAETVGEGDVCARLPVNLRSVDQCYSRYYKVMGADRRVRKGKWAYTEDMRLLAAVRAYQPAQTASAAPPSPSPSLSTSLPWCMISRHVPHRTDIAARERYVFQLHRAGSAH